MRARTARDAEDRVEADGARERPRPARSAHGQLPRVRRVRGPAGGAPPQARRPPTCEIPLLLSHHYQRLMRRSEAWAAERGRLRARALAVRGVRARAQEVRRRRRALGHVQSTHKLGAGLCSVEAVRMLLQRGAEFWAEPVRVELSFVEDLRRCWDVPGVTTGGEVMDVHDEVREDVMHRAIVVIHRNVAGVTWVVVACFPRSCHRCATLATEVVPAALSRLMGTLFTILQSCRTAAKRIGKGSSSHAVH
jgi:hypothetical protein